VRVILALTLPVATLLIVAIRPLIADLRRRRRRDSAGLLATSAYLLRLAGHSLLEVSARSFTLRARTPYSLLSTQAPTSSWQYGWLPGSDQRELR
jgi:hypothetical protein